MGKFYLIFSMLSSTCDRMSHFTHKIILSNFLQKHNTFVRLKCFWGNVYKQWLEAISIDSAVAYKITFWFSNFQRACFSLAIFVSFHSSTTFSSSVYFCSGQNWRYFSLEKWDTQRYYLYVTWIIKNQKAPKLES